MPDQGESEEKRGLEIKNRLNEILRGIKLTPITEKIPGSDTQEQSTLSQLSHIKKLSALKEQDHEWRIKARKIYGTAFMVLLFGQNAIVFTLVIVSYFRNDLSQLAIILGIIVNGTLLETAFLIRIIVKWLFDDIPYNIPYNKRKR